MARKDTEREVAKTTLENAIKRNPYNPKQGSTGAYIRYLRYNVDGWYMRPSEEIRKELGWDKTTKER